MSPESHTTHRKYSNDGPSKPDTFVLVNSSSQQNTTPASGGRRAWSRRTGWRFGRYFRLHDRDDERPSFRGWRKAVVATAIAAGVVLVMNLTFAVVAMAKFSVMDGIGQIYIGDCGVVKRWNTALHLLINVLSTMLLAASSFTLQCLGCPTRSEVDAAHQKRLALDIGLTSFTNLFYIKWWKAWIWLMLCLTTVPFHLL